MSQKDNHLTLKCLVLSVPLWAHSFPAASESGFWGKLMLKFHLGLPFPQHTYWCAKNVGYLTIMKPPSSQILQKAQHKFLYILSSFTWVRGSVSPSAPMAQLCENSLEVFIPVLRFLKLLLSQLALARGINWKECPLPKSLMWKSLHVAFAVQLLPCLLLILMESVSESPS